MGGLRSPHATVMQCQVAINIGVQIRNLIDGYLDRDPRIEAALLGSIGQPIGVFLYLLNVSTPSGST